MSDCSKCGAPLRITPGLPVADCGYCGHRVALESEPGGAQIALADFSGPTTTGWRAWAADPGEVVRNEPGPPPCYYVALPAKPAGVSLMRIDGTFDDIDLTVGIQFGAGASTEASFAFRFRARRESDGHRDGYAAKLYVDGYTGIEWRNEKAHGGWLAKIAKTSGPWDPAAPHSFRVLAVGSRMRLYLDGALVGSFDDGRFGLGHVYATLSAGPQPIDARIFYLSAREGRLR